MGTRSLTHIKDEQDNTLVTLYKQYAGEFESYGLDLAEFLAQFTIVNGISVGEERKVANGAGCLAAQVIAEFKEDAGGYYVYPPDSKDCGEEYTYTITVTKDMNIYIKAEDFYDNKLNFKGTVAEFISKFK